MTGPCSTPASPLFSLSSPAPWARRLRPPPSPSPGDVAPGPSGGPPALLPGVHGLRVDHRGRRCQPGASEPHGWGTDGSVSPGPGLGTHGAHMAFLPPVEELGSCHISPHWSCGEGSTGTRGLGAGGHRRGAEAGQGRGALGGSPWWVRTGSLGGQGRPEPLEGGVQGAGGTEPCRSGTGAPDTAVWLESV